MLDRNTFIRPYAHRGLHDAARGVIENSGPAFEAAIGVGYGIECDLQPAADGAPIVFHDETLARLVDAPGKTTDHTAAALARMTYRADPSARILGLADFLALVAGRVPLLIEIKSTWLSPDPRFLGEIARVLQGYGGPFAVMSFDPAVMTAVKAVLPDAPRGIVSGVYTASWLPAHVDPDRAFSLTHLLESRPAEPHFFAYHVASLPTPVTRFARDGLGLPLFTWTVRTAAQLGTARRWADAPIFEKVDPRS